MKNTGNMELEIKMIKYEEARIELYKKVKALEETIKFLKENTYYEKRCLNCNNESFDYWRKISKKKILQQ